MLDDAAPTVLLPTRDPAEALRRLRRARGPHVWLEGGPTLAAAFLRAGLVDEVVSLPRPGPARRRPRGGGRPRHHQHRPTPAARGP